MLIVTRRFGGTGRADAQSASYNDVIGLRREGLGMGVFSVPIKIRNWQNQFLPSDQQGEEVECEAVVDTGAAELGLPADLVERLRLMPLDNMEVSTADGALHVWRVCGIAEVELQGRRAQVRVIELPRGSRPLLGAIPLEEMDWHISPLEQKLMPSPKSPDRPSLPMY